MPKSARKGLRGVMRNHVAARRKGPDQLSTKKKDTEVGNENAWLIYPEARNKATEEGSMAEVEEET